MFCVVYIFLKIYDECNYYIWYEEIIIYCLENIVFYIIENNIEYVYYII